ncbi:MAG TPA: GNAT family N-acetyltransferase [Rhizomicrobium sp.]|nr:GNAT family N-acetyltransferase [Rhizomicrobium sp.]
MIDYSPLDNPVWSSLATGHVAMARVHGAAMRYPGDISPLSAVREPSRPAFADLRALAKPGEIVGLVTAFEIAIPDDWEVVLSRFIDQMVCEDFQPASDIAPLLLSDKDVPEMVALTKLTQPGPFEHGTIGMGKYLGVRSESGALMAMAGQRMSLTDFREISAVCTHPDHQGKGYAGRLMTVLAREIIADGRTPFLHVKTENASAKHLYAKLGFRVRKAMHFNVIRPR